MTHGAGPRRLRVGHLTTVDLSLWALLGTELEVDVEAGFEVYGISAPGPDVPRVEALGVTHVAVPAFTRAPDLRADLRAAGQLWGVLRDLELDVLHTHTPKAGVLGRVLGRAARIPVVVHTTHGLWAGPDAPAGRRLVVTAIEALAAQCSDVELYQNDTDRRTLAWAVPGRRAWTVGNGVDLDRFRPDPAGAATWRRQLGLLPQELLVGGVGRRVAEKGLHEFATMARRLAGRARFVWVGPTDPTKPDAVDALDGVEFVGARDDMPSVYTALDVFVLPSHREGFSRSAMEAAACGTAMVLTDIRGCREIGEPDRHVRFVPPRDVDALTAAVGDLLDDPALRARLGSAAAARAREAFDQRAVARRSLAAYEAAASARRSTLPVDVRGSWPRRSSTSGTM